MKKKFLWILAGVVVIAAVSIVITERKESGLDELSVETAAINEEITIDESSAEAAAINEEATVDESSAEATAANNDIAVAGITINADEIGTEASFYDVDIDGTKVEVFAVAASDKTLRLAMNTCQVCNGSPYAYFEQIGDVFVCQNCGNQFTTDDVGIESGGCNPVPITEENFSEENGIITVSQDFLKSNAYRFKNWKQF